ncbi:MAG: hypothetical protein AzoDbin1_04740 [Azoarcus sp.]|nr:hypothetical protein [Azoarcus sp.]
MTRKSSIESVPGHDATTFVPMNRGIAQHRLGGGTVADVAKPSPITVSPNAPISMALSLMARHRIGSVIVVEKVGRRPVGVITLQDVLLRVAIPDIDKVAPISTVMTKQLTTIPASASVHEAALMMARSGIRHLIIVDASGALRGVISRNDLYDLLCSTCISIRNAGARRT